jgi:poly-beta-hydroxyalkanoate depolymerase
MKMKLSDTQIDDMIKRARADADGFERILETPNFLSRRFCMYADALQELKAHRDFWRRSAQDGDDKEAEKKTG